MKIHGVELEAARLDVRPGDVVVVTVRGNIPLHAILPIAERLSCSELRDVTTIFVPDSVSLAAVSEDEMRRAGWVRAEIDIGDMQDILGSGDAGSPMPMVSVRVDDLRKALGVAVVPGPEAGMFEDVYSEHPAALRRLGWAVLGALGKKPSSEDPS